MKTFKTLLLILLVIASLSMISACKKSADQKLADAQVNEAVADQNVTDAQAKANATDDWQAFKAEAETKITANDKIIADYKVKMTNAKGKLLASYDKKIDALELKNKALRTKLYDYKDDGKGSWEKFKSEFNSDIDELGTSLKNFAVDNKK